MVPCICIVGVLLKVARELGIQPPTREELRGARAVLGADGYRTWALGPTTPPAVEPAPAPSPTEE